MAASMNDDKLGGTVASDRRLEVSVSFGRFENDSLCWEKWSSFSQNKYLEEVEKCATPGSVAQKKAYFEAHYKKIAARKLEQLKVGTESPRSDDRNFYGEDLGFNASNAQTVNEIAAINIHNQDSLAERVESNKPDEAAAISEGETRSLELPNKLVKETERTAILKEEPVKLNSLKVSPSSKVRDMTKMKNKPASTAKATETGITSNTLSKKVTGSSLPKNKACSIGGSKKVAPKSLHMSLSMATDSPSPDPASTPFTGANKSFIMEKMKDKEIVKRAFKTFHNNFNQLRSSVEAKQVPTKGSENKVCSSITPRKENAGSLKAVNMDKKTAKTAPCFGLKSYERAEKSNEKLQDKSKGKQSESIRLQTKSKEEKVAEIKKLRYSLNFRATPLPGFNQGKKSSRSPLHKEGSRTVGI